MIADEDGCNQWADMCLIFGVSEVSTIENSISRTFMDSICTFHGRKIEYRSASSG
jgi:hypothetical protein